MIFSNLKHFFYEDNFQLSFNLTASTESDYIGSSHFLLHYDNNQITIRQNNDQIILEENLKFPSFHGIDFEEKLIFIDFNSIFIEIKISDEGIIFDIYEQDSDSLNNLFSAYLFEDDLFQLNEISD